MPEGWPGTCFCLLLLALTAAGRPGRYAFQSSALGGGLTRSAFQTLFGEISVLCLRRKRQKEEGKQLVRGVTEGDGEREREGERGEGGGE